MKLPIKQKWFKLIKNGKKNIEYRDNHITFVCEETGEELKKEIIECGLVDISEGPEEAIQDGSLKSKTLVCFWLGKNNGKNKKKNAK